MKEVFIENFALLLYNDLPAQKVAHCTTFTNNDTTVIEFQTEQELQAYVTTNGITIS